MLKGDLHIHSNISDGSMSMEEITNMAIHNQLDLIAFTEHDTLAHLDKLPISEQIKVIGGIEISAIDKNTNIKAHILGYGIQDIELVEKIVSPLLIKRHENSLKQCKILKSMGYKLPINEISKADNKYIYKQHIMEYLVKTNQVKERFGEFYLSTFKNKGPCDFDIEYIDVNTAVETVSKAGGLAVLAHSGQQQNFYLIDELVKLGLRGLEYNHEDNSEADKKVIAEYAHKYNLFLTGGSDYHGTNSKAISDIGSYLSEESGITEIISL